MMRIYRFPPLHPRGGYPTRTLTRSDPRPHSPARTPINRHYPSQTDPQYHPGKPERTSRRNPPKVQCGQVTLKRCRKKMFGWCINNQKIAYSTSVAPRYITHVEVAQIVCNYTQKNMYTNVYFDLTDRHFSMQKMNTEMDKDRGGNPRMRWRKFTYVVHKCHSCQMGKCAYHNFLYACLPTSLFSSYIIIFGFEPLSIIFFSIAERINRSSFK